jgi:hypothetical protein
MLLPAVLSSVLASTAIVAFIVFSSQWSKFCFAGNAERCIKSNALRGEGMRLSVRAVKAALLAFIGAKRRALTGEAGGSGAGFSQEGQPAQRTVEERVFYVG